MRKADIFFYNGPIMTCAAADGIIESGFLAVKDGLIADTGKLDQTELEQYPAHEKIDLRGNLLMPGLVNAHNHAAMTLFRGLADDLPLMEWLHKYIFPVEQKLTFDWVYWGSKLACLEMIASGTTSFVDMYLFAEAVAQAVEDTGMRALVGEALYDFPSPNYGPAEQGFQYTRDLAQKWRNNPKIQIAIEPHAPYTCSPKLLKSCRDVAEEMDIPILTHLSETAHEVQEIQQKYNMTPVQYLKNNGLLYDRTRAAHVVHVTPWEMELLAEAGVSVVHLPESNMKLASGAAPLLELKEYGITLGLGTDGCASNNNLDMLQEMDSAAKLQKLVNEDPTALPAMEVVNMATQQSAQIMNLADKVGSLTVGKQADLIIIDFNQPHLTPVYDYFSHVVYAASGADVISTMVAGKWLMRDRQFQEIDVEEVYTQVRRIASDIRRHVNIPLA